MDKCQGHVNNHQLYDQAHAASQAALNNVSAHCDQLISSATDGHSLEERQIKLQACSLNVL